MKLLLIEDDGDEAFLFEQLLNRMGKAFDYTHAESLQEAEDAIELSSFDVIIADLGLPDSQGLDTLRAVHHVAPETPIIVLTNLDEDAIGDEAIKAGAQDYLPKGKLSRDVLDRSMRYAVERWKLDQAQQAESQRTLSAIQENAQYKTMFMNMASHDLRNPLVPMRLESEMLNTGMYGGLTEEQKEAVGAISEGIHRMESLLEDLLAVARIDAGKLGLEKAPTALHTLVEEVLQNNEATAQAANVQFEVALTEMIVEIDRNRMLQVVENLVSNAIKYSPNGGSVTVTLSANPTQLTVKDQGIGLSAEAIGKMFTPFEKFHGSEISVASNGLGLTIVKGLVEEHGGNISVESAGKGKGSTFTVRLP